MVIKLKKHNISRRISAVAALLAVLMLVSCTSQTGKTAIKLGDTVVTENMYNYWASYCKGYYMAAFGDEIEDKESFWTSDYGDGMTPESVFNQYILDFVKEITAASYLFDYYKLSLSETAENDIDSEINDLVENYGGGSEAEFNSYASNFGINKKILRQILEMETKHSVIQSYLYQNNIIEAVSDEDREEYYQSSFAHTKHIYISTSYSFNIAEDGTYIYDDSGSYLTDLTEAQAKAQKELADKIEAELTADNFEEMMAKYNEDPTASGYPDGYYFSANSDYVQSYITKALTMDEGEIVRIDTTDAVFFIKKYPLEEKAYENDEYADFFDGYDTTIKTLKYRSFIDTYFAEMQVEDNLTAIYSIKNVTPCMWY